MQFPGVDITFYEQAEGMNRLVFELAVVAAQEKAILDECEALLASAAAKQVKYAYQAVYSQLLLFFKYLAYAYTSTANDIHFLIS